MTTKATLGAWLAKLRRRLQTRLKRPGVDSARVALAASSLDDVVESDRDADIAWRGVELGFAIAVFDRDALATSVQRDRQRRGKETRAAILKKRNANLANEYRGHVARGLTDLAARQRLSADHELSLKVVNTALKSRVQETPG